MNYWKSQLILCSIGAVAFPVLGVVMFTLKPDEPGFGLIMFLTGIGFFIAAIQLVSKFINSTNEQRLVYAWAIEQQHSAMTAPYDASVSAAEAGFKSMSIAELARKGTLTRDQINYLQALRPTVPYPAELPVETTLPPLA